MNKNIIYAIVAIVIVGVLIWLGFNREDAPETSPTPAANGQSSPSPTPTGQIPGGGTNEPGNVFEGTLRASNISSRGNLMLVSDNMVIYIRTARDFRKLIGKQVSISIDGTVDNFVLRDIQEK